MNEKDKPERKGHRGKRFTVTRRISTKNLLGYEDKEFDDYLTDLIWPDQKAELQAESGVKIDGRDKNSDPPDC